MKTQKHPVRQQQHARPVNRDNQINHRHGQRPQRQPSDASSVTPATIGHESLEEAARQALRFYFRRLRKTAHDLGRSEPDYRNGDDGETVHDARVAARGLRALLALLETEPEFKRKRLRRLRKRLGRLAQALGKVRDADVLLAYLAAYEAEEAEHSEVRRGLRPLRDELQRRRVAARSAVNDLLATKKSHRLLRELNHLTRKRRANGMNGMNRSKGAKSGGHPRHPILVRHFAGSAIWRRYEAILRYETCLPGASMETLHTLRIACKGLRYSLQLFGPKQPPESLEPLISALKVAQDHLGHLHDLLLASEIVRTLPSAPALDGYLAALTSESEQLRASIAPIWERLSGAEPRHLLADFIAAL